MRGIILDTYDEWAGAVVDIALVDGNDFERAKVVDLWMGTSGLPSQMHIRTPSGYETVIQWHAVASYTVITAGDA